MEQNLKFSHIEKLQYLLSYAKSHLIYFRPGMQTRMKKFYSEFMQPGDCSFDIGSHLGNRISPWLGLGAHVVAVEPHPFLHKNLQARWQHCDEVTLLDCAVSDSNDPVELMLSPGHLTLGTINQEWTRLVQKDQRFRSVGWTKTHRVSSITIEDLIDRYGVPAFIKIDVEGAEWQVVSQLKTPVKSLSIEFIPVAADIAQKCVRHMSSLAEYRYNFSYTESMKMIFSTWLSFREIMNFIQNQPLLARSGDIYAVKK